MVGPSGLEPPTSCLSGTRSNLLSYDPIWLVVVFHLDGGDDGIRTHDPLLAGQVLSQLSYTPIIKCKMQNAKCRIIRFNFSPFATLPYATFHFEFCISNFAFDWGSFRFLGRVGIELSSRAASSQVFSPLQSLTSVFGMGTGGPSAFVTPTFSVTLHHWILNNTQSRSFFRQNRFCLSLNSVKASLDL